MAGPSRRRSRVDPPRRAAYDVLRAVRVDAAYTNLVLPAVLAEHGLTGRDAAFVTELTSGTIRMQRTYDAVLDACIDRPLRKVQAKVLDCLRLGTHQLLAMRVPDHAAIDTTVDLVRDRADRGAAGFANAVLRKVAVDDLDTWRQRIGPDPGVVHSHPEWVVAALREAVGEAELADLLAADNVPPRVTLVARPGRSTREELPGEPTRYSPYGVVFEGGVPGEVPAVAEGRAAVQDEGSQLVAHALASAPLAGRDERWLDLCAGPGGKAALLAALAGERDAALVAVEQHAHRAALVRRALDGAGTVLTADGTAPPLEAESFDRVLVDAPCTGLGALRRRPEARWRRQPGDVPELVVLQQRLLASALDLVRPGGLVLYATCSPVLAETRDVVAAATGAEVVDVRQHLPGLDDAEGPLPGTAQLWPHRHGTDAMFLALLQRSGEPTTR
ncbi:hypothetical protein KUV85_05730 [Nocardioides panacisoli]|uniref:RsmB/NOP family class I SAM-dependent RNA methyltransferase n=1 Tax=Nocardioides panacisoli TaxID=627624 RepID=UPI001C6282EB|nr:transcription antitermination factor NusB [Nocardioides panacisoli]QYJ05181.1 hypothetical protein KUV85_05730 [Nocardioides panacisoli]